jgi:hypothetical protein
MREQPTRKKFRSSCPNVTITDPRAVLDAFERLVGAYGTPAVLTLAEADAELQRLNLLKKNHLDEQYVARRSVRDF